MSLLQCGLKTSAVNTKFGKAEVGGTGAPESTADAGPATWRGLSAAPGRRLPKVQPGPATPPPSPSRSSPASATRKGAGLPAAWLLGNGMPLREATVRTAWGKGSW